MSKVVVPYMPAIVHRPTSSAAGHFTTTNTSTNGSVDSEFGISTTNRIVYQTAAIAMTLLTAYVVFALSKYNWVKSGCQQSRSDNSGQRGKSRTSVLTSDSSTSNTTGSGKTKSASERSTCILRFMSLAAAVFTLVRITCEQLELAPSNEHRMDCRGYQVAMVLTYCISISTLYAILWYRVKVFLSHPAMRHLGSKVLNILAYVVLFLIGLASIANSVMFLVTTISEDDVGGCMVLSPGNVVSNTARFAILTVSTVLFQVSLLALFLYPLVRHQAAMRAGKIDASTARKCDSVRRSSGSRWCRRNSSSNNKEKKKMKRQRAIVKIIRRVMITAVLCAVSDIFCGLIVQAVVEKPRIVTNLIFDGNLLINLGCVLASFKDWRVRLIPCYSKQRKVRRKDSECYTKTTLKDKVCPTDLTHNGSCNKPLPVFPSSESGIHSLSPPKGSMAEFDNGHHRSATDT